MSQVVGLPNNSYKPFTNTAWVQLQKGCTRLAAASDKVYRLLAHSRWFSSGTPASSTIKTGSHDIVEILLKVALKHQKSINLRFIQTSVALLCQRICFLAHLWISGMLIGGDLNANVISGTVLKHSSITFIVFNYTNVPCILKVHKACSYERHYKDRQNRMDDL